jgi:large subunit ribosomal protein L10
MRPEKLSIIREIEAALAGSEYVYLVDYNGMSVAQFSELRGALAEAGAELHIQKNTFLGIALGEGKKADLGDCLMGPTGVVTGTGDATVVAKVLAKYSKDNEVPSFKGGTFGEQALSAEDIEALAKIPPREVLLSQLVGTVQAPMTNLVGVMNAKVLSLLYVLNAIEDKKKNAA